MKRYKAEDYTYRVSWHPEDKSWVAAAEEFGSLSNASGDSPQDAFSGMVDLLQSVLDDIYGDGEEPPAPFWSREARSTEFVYEAVIEPVGERFEARFPDLGIITQGDDLEDAAIMAQDLLRNHVIMSIQENRRLPEPTFGGECPEGSYRMGIVVDCGGLGRRAAR